MSKGDQETERVPIICDSVRTGIALMHQSLGEVGLQQFGEGGLSFHRPASFGCKRRVASCNSSGTAERYQYVSRTRTWPRYVLNSGKCTSTSVLVRYH